MQDKEVSDVLNPLKSREVASRKKGLMCMKFQTSCLVIVREWLFSDLSKDGLQRDTRIIQEAAGIIV